MHPLHHELLQRKTYLQQIIKNKKKALQKVPEGILNVCAHGNRTQYYFKKDSKDTHRKYMRESELPLVKSLCQKDYDEKVLLLAEKELFNLDRYLTIITKKTCDSVYDELVKQRQEHIIPIRLTDEMYVENWLNEEYTSKSFPYDYPEYYTDKGERVRSKSEILIANALNKHNIPYRYECPVYLRDFVTLYPDFTVLNVRTRQELLWEHFGMMDLPEYAEKAVLKLETYQKNNIFIGKQLILTHETSKHPINSKNIEKIILEYLT